MAQPTPYDRITNFQNDQALAPTDPYPGEDFDAEYNAVKITTDEIIQNLSLIQRDDGELANGSVGRDQLDPEISLGFSAPEPWETATEYVDGDTVFANNGFYLCEVNHTSTVFVDDLNAGYWFLLADFAAGAAPALGVGFTPYGDLSSTNVQLALQELDDEKVSLAGDTLLGHLSLPTSPAAANAVRKDYVDAAVSTVAGTVDDKLSKTTTDTATGPITFVNASGYDEGALTYSASVIWDTATKPVATLALAGNATMTTPTGVVAGRVYTIRIVQNAASTVAWTAANFKFIGASVPVITATASAVDRFTFIGRASNVLEEIGRAQGIA